MIEVILIAVLAMAAAFSSYFSYRAARALLDVRAEAIRLREDAYDQIVAVRKETKAMLNIMKRTNASAQRVAEKQFTQYQQVNDLYEAMVARERENLNG